MYYIESKATWEDRFDIAMLTQVQHDGLADKSKIPYVYGVVAVLFASYKRAFLFDIRELDRLKEEFGQKSLNIKKIDRWPIQYAEIQTIPNNRKKLLDYQGDINQYRLQFEQKLS